MITIKISIFYCFHPNYAKYFIVSVRYCTKNMFFILYMSSSKLYSILKYFAQLFRFKSITSSKDNFVWIDIPLWKMSRQNITASLINLYHEIVQYEMYPSRFFFFPFFQSQIISGRKLFQSPKHFSVKCSSRNYRKWSKKKKLFWCFCSELVKRGCVYADGGGWWKMICIFVICIRWVGRCGRISGRVGVVVMVICGRDWWWWIREVCGGECDGVDWLGHFLWWCNVRKVMVLL